MAGLRGVLGHRNLVEQLAEPDGRLFEGAARAGSRLTRDRSFGFAGGNALISYYIVLRYNNDMRVAKTKSAPAETVRILAEFRHQLRLFLHFSETAAQKVGLQPQQHQLLLQIAGASQKSTTTVGYAAERLGLRHNTVVELSNRCAEAGLVVRKQSGPDRRCVVLELTPRGRRLLEALSIDHACELNELGPQLIRALNRLKAAHRSPAKRWSRRER